MGRAQLASVQITLSFAAQAIDLLYVNGDVAAFRKDAVSITKQGTLAITASRGKTVAPYSAPWGDQRAEVPYKAGMVRIGCVVCWAGGQAG